MPQIFKALIKTQLLKDWHCKSSPYPVGQVRELQGRTQNLCLFSSDSETSFHFETKLRRERKA